MSLIFVVRIIGFIRFSWREKDIVIKRPHSFFLGERKWRVIVVHGALLLSPPPTGFKAGSDDISLGFFLFFFLPYLTMFSFSPSSNAGISFSVKCNGRPQSRLSTCTVAAASVRINKGE